MEKIPASSSQSPAMPNMRLAYAADGTVVYKPVSGVSPPPYQGGGNGGEGAAASGGHGLNTDVGEPLKRKRGRPRKYGPEADGTVTLAAVPVSAALAGAPPESGKMSLVLPAETADPASAIRPPVFDMKQQMDTPGLVGVRSTPHVIAAKAREIREDAQLEDEEASSKKNVKWTAEMDCCLTDALVKQIQSGNKIDKSFTNYAYLAACDAIYVQFRKKLSVPHLKNRLKTLKKDLTAFKNMENSASGFSFNRVTKMMDAEPGVWDTFLKVHPEARQFRHKAVPSYENLCIIFGKDRVIGQSSETTKEKRVRVEEPDEINGSNHNPLEEVEIEIDEESGGEKQVRVEKEPDEINGSNHDLVEEVEIEIDEESGGESINTSGMPKQVPNGPSLCKPFPKMAPRRKHAAIDDLKEEFSMLKSRIDSVASAIERSNPRMIPEEKLFEEVRKIEGLDVDFRLLAYDYLCQDIIRGRTFVGLPVDLRKRWLELKLHQHAR